MYSINYLKQTLFRIILNNKINMIKKMAWKELSKNNPD